MPVQPGVHKRKFSKSISTAPDAKELGGPITVKLHTEPEQDIRVLGELVRDVGTMKDMLTELVFATSDGYLQNLRVVRNAAERTIRRCDRLLGDPASAES